MFQIITYVSLYNLHPSYLGNIKITAQNSIFPILLVFSIRSQTFLRTVAHDFIFLFEEPVIYPLVIYDDFSVAQWYLCCSRVLKSGQ